MDYLKDVFGTEALTFEQFSEKVNAGKMKLVDLSGGAYVGKDKFDNLQTRLDEANTTITTLTDQTKKFEGVDIEQIKADYEQKIADLTYSQAATAHASKHTFTSTAARKAYIDDLVKQGLKVGKDGSLMGADDFDKTYKTNDPGAFKPEPSGGAGFSDKQPPGQDKNAASYMDKFMRGQLE